MKFGQIHPFESLEIYIFYFQELLQEAEADETEASNWTVKNPRCIPGSNRRRHKRDSVSERLTHGGSLQNLAQSINSEFDTSFACLTSGSNQVYGGSGRRKVSKKYANIPTSVSARQREGGSLPSNVNASHTLASVANFDLVLDKRVSGLCSEEIFFFFVVFFSSFFCFFFLTNFSLGLIFLFLPTRETGDFSIGILRQNNFLF